MSRSNRKAGFGNLGFLVVVFVSILLAAPASSSLSYQSDPADLPVMDLVRDLYQLHFNSSADGVPEWRLIMLVGQRHALGEVDESTFDLLAAIDADQVDYGIFPSLAALDIKEQTATVVLATLLLTDGFEGDWAEVVRLVYGPERTVLEVALELNQANESPLSDDEVEDLPFLDHGLVYEIARGFDKMSGCTSQHCRASAETVVENPVVQWMTAFRAGERAKYGQPREHLWEIETEEELNLLIYLLGDHVAPEVPALDPVASPTAQSPIAVSGTAEADAFIDVYGGDQPAASRASGTGAFSVEVHLLPNQPNALLVTATDPAGNTGEAVEVVVVHDDIPPVIVILEPARGTITDMPAITISGNVSDVNEVSVYVNGFPVLVQDGAFSLVGLPLDLGENSIVSVAVDAAGNFASDLSAVYLVEEGEYPPGGFGIIGPEGGTVSVDDPDSPFAGASVEIPPGALDEETVITIRPGGGAPDIVGFIPVGPIYELLPSDQEFNVPVTLVVPYEEGAVPEWATEEEIGVYFVEPGDDEWTRLEGTVEIEQDQIVVHIMQFSFVAPGVPIEPEFGKFCEEKSVSYKYEGDIYPGEDGWAYHGIGGEVWIDASRDVLVMDMHGPCREYPGPIFPICRYASFQRAENNIIMAPKYELAISLRAELFQHGDYSNVAFGARDGLKEVWVFGTREYLGENVYGDYRLGIFLQGYEMMLVPREFLWGEFHEFRVVVDRSSKDPAKRMVYLYIDGGSEPVLTVPYGDLPDADPVDDAMIFGMTTGDSYSEWDYYRYNICGDPDIDDDGIPNSIDNCPLVFNTNQADNEDDGIGDVCDEDDDNDSVQDSTDNCQFINNTGQENFDQDEYGDVCDVNVDGLGRVQLEDAFVDDLRNYMIDPWIEDITVKWNYSDNIKLLWGDGLFVSLDSMGCVFTDPAISILCFFDNYSTTFGIVSSNRDVDLLKSTQL